MRTHSLDALEGGLDYRFRDRTRLERALTHRSFAHEQPAAGGGDNERLEFLGDALLGFLVSDWLCRLRPDFSEGELSTLKSVLVSAANLRRYGDALSLGDHLKLGKGEERTGGREKPALVVNAFEAVLAAVYLDGGLDAASAVVRRLFAEQVGEIAAGRWPVSNFKSALQERLQSTRRAAARYRLVERAGPGHEPRFTVEVSIDGGPVALGTGTTKKQAEQAAAQGALDALRAQDGDNERRRSG